MKERRERAGGQEGEGMCLFKIDLSRFNCCGKRAGKAQGREKEGRNKIAKREEMNHP